MVNRFFVAALAHGVGVAFLAKADGDAWLGSVPVAGETEDLAAVRVDAAALDEKKRVLFPEGRIEKGRAVRLVAAEAGHALAGLVASRIMRRVNAVMTLSAEGTHAPGAEREGLGQLAPRRARVGGVAPGALQAVVGVGETLLVAVSGGGGEGTRRGDVYHRSTLCSFGENHDPEVLLPLLVTSQAGMGHDGVRPFLLGGEDARARAAVFHGALVTVQAAFAKVGIEASLVGARRD
jgi:hypothetical protein